MDIETCWYEFSPYLYIIVGVISIAFSASYLAMLPGGLLVIAALTILRMRWVHRRAQDAKVKRAL
jgi:hypothetical protein